MLCGMPSMSLFKAIQLQNDNDIHSSTGLIRDNWVQVTIWQGTIHSRLPEVDVVRIRYYYEVIARRCATLPYERIRQKENRVKTAYSST